MVFHTPLLQIVVGETTGLQWTGQTFMRAEFEGNVPMLLLLLLLLLLLPLLFVSASAACEPHLKSV